ncbi:NAD(P)-dependent oxidoreductase [Leisingera methylohalidivorans]|uniref:3-hydroxyisobutyrate dehydrogenase n=1 Tax=Leisingera methylohalidivorans DSM 14336 TaxID=999552 RepID=V9VWR3_9RHOB|nr:NAD(P)-dependent oxidoreductase [Leisingera methylohalidivorans]AHD02169.1 3-hydroxyisobutyrate dehydrogenase [Leisingera methylohalidivorans DSM 14336]
MAVLGTGLMGAPMARNIAATGCRVTVWNRTSAKALSLAVHNIAPAADSAEAVLGADVIVTMLKDAGAIAEAVSTLPDADSAPASPVCWLQMSTVGPADLPGLQSLADRKGLTLIDAPVLGTRQLAEAGQLLVLAAGPEETRDAVRPVLEAIGKATRWLDTGPGTATRLKLALNSWVFALTHGAAESLALARGLGLDPALVAETLRGGPLDTAFFQMKAQAMVADDFTPAFTIDNAVKDSVLILDAARAAGVRADLAEAGLNRYRRVQGQGRGDADMAASILA